MYIHKLCMLYIYMYISSVKSYTNNKTSNFAWYYFQLHAKVTLYTPPAYIKDKLDFINKIRGTENITKDAFLVTLDVKLLYTNIPNCKGIEAAKEALNSENKSQLQLKLYSTSH